MVVPQEHLPKSQELALLLEEAPSTAQAQWESSQVVPLAAPIE